MVKLFTAGPVNSVIPHVPEIGHREPEFEQLYKAVNNKLLKLCNANPEEFEMVIIGGSGTAAIESTISSVCEYPLIISNGAFGERAIEISRIYNMIDIIGSKKCFIRKWGDNINIFLIEQVLKDNPELKEIYMVYMETSTGMLNPINEIGKLCKKYNKTFIVDAVSAIGVEFLDMEKNNIDFCIINTNKGIGGPPVMSAVCCRKSKLNNLKHRNFYLDLSKYLRYGLINQTPFTPAIPLFYLLNENLDELFKEGLNNRIERCKRCTELLRNELEKLGLEFYLKDNLAHAITNVMIPKGFTFEYIHNKLKENGFIIYPGKEKLKDKIMHIATMGTINENDVLKFTKVLGEIIK